MSVTPSGARTPGDDDDADADAFGELSPFNYQLI